MGDQGIPEPDTDAGSSIIYTSPIQQQNQVAQSQERNEQAVRSRWTPKPEQILILESIFNSGMVNPPKDQTIKIRRLLERFGPVGDANVFYWFQNRRSRSRRRQRQMQATIMEANNARNAQNYKNHYEPSSNFYNPSSSSMINNQMSPGFVEMAGSNNNAAEAGDASQPPFASFQSFSEPLTGSASAYSPSALAAGNFYGSGAESFFSEMGFEEVDQDNGSQTIAPSYLCTYDVASDSQFQQPGVTVGSSGGGDGGFVTVFLNGTPTDVPRGPLDVKAMCGGQDFMLVHSSGQPVPVNEYGFSAHSLQHGESYFLVAKPI